eukprot:Seg208.12 transcript_id=Seg208.12/GoldUCD/mRNA.D3Y31 product="LINE-1 retrotransposable element ORF2 protein" pseudo=true protein_id=Seg208.12/GoldUCD/D3Y31
MLQTTIDINTKRGNNIKLVIADVKKAFDQAWRAGVFNNLTDRNIKCNILTLIIEINQNLVARIKGDEESYSQNFTVEESIRQGSGLSAILYAQHAAKVIEDVEKTGRGTAIGRKIVPAIGWQDDITLIIPEREDEAVMIQAMTKSAEENQIIFSEEKCKILIIGKQRKRKFDDTFIGGQQLQEVDHEKILGHHFSKGDNNITHIQRKEEEIINMVASLGLTIENETMSSAYMKAMIILYKKRMIPKLLYGMGAFATTKKEE